MIKIKIVTVFTVILTSRFSDNTINIRKVDQNNNIINRRKTKVKSDTVTKTLGKTLKIGGMTVTKIFKSNLKIAATILLLLIQKNRYNNNDLNKTKLAKKLLTYVTKYFMNIIGNNKFVIYNEIETNKNKILKF